MQKIILKNLIFQDFFAIIIIESEEKSMNKFELTATEIKVIDNAIDNIINCEVERTVIRNVEGKDYMRPEDWFRQYKVERHDIYAT